MTSDTNTINSYVETSSNSPKRTRPTDKQMGLGSHDFFTSKEKKQKKSTPNA